MTQQELEQQLSDLDTFVRNVWETMGTMNQQLHSLGHKVMELEEKLDRGSQPAPQPFRFPR